MRFESRSYNPGPLFRPRPFVINREESGLLIVASSWTSQADAERISQMLIERIESNANSDVSMILHQAILDVSMIVYKENSRQARLLVEVLAIQIRDRSVFWAQAGQPNLYLLRRGRVAPLSVQPDHSLVDRALAPLPRVGLGLESAVAVQSGSVRFQPEDRLLCLAQSWEPAWPEWTETPGFDRLTKDLILKQSDLAFWCGLVSE